MATYPGMRGPSDDGLDMRGSCEVDEGRCYTRIQQKPSTTSFLTNVPYDNDVK